MSRGPHPYKGAATPRRGTPNPDGGAAYASSSHFDRFAPHATAAASGSQTAGTPAHVHHAREGSGWSSRHHPATNGRDSHRHSLSYGQPAPQVTTVSALYAEDKPLNQDGFLLPPLDRVIPQAKSHYDLPTTTSLLRDSRNPPRATVNLHASNVLPLPLAAFTGSPLPAMAHHPSYSVLPLRKSVILASRCQSSHLMTAPRKVARHQPLPIPSISISEIPSLSEGRLSLPGVDVLCGPELASRGAQLGALLGYCSEPPPSCPSPPSTGTISPSPARGRSTPPTVTRSLSPLPSSRSQRPLQPLFRPSPPTGRSTPSVDQARPRLRAKCSSLGPAVPPAAPTPDPYSLQPSQTGDAPSWRDQILPSTTPVPPTSARALSQGSRAPSSAMSNPTRFGATPTPASCSIAQPQPTPSILSHGGPQYFPNAQGFQISTMTVGNVNNNQLSTSAKSVYDFLQPYICHGAAHDSDERCDAPACHEETRLAIRGNIMSWITHGDRAPEPKRIMWLSGPAGGGKTAIAGSVAEACKKEGLLAGTFMFSSFSGSPGRMSKRGLIMTLAYHMSQHEALQSFNTHLLRALEKHRDISHKQLREQAECLILAPIRSINKRDRAGWPSAVIIDGLDEVVAERREDPTGRQRPRTSEEDQVEILEVLLTLSQSPSFPFCIFISSRPERNITQFFETSMAQRLTLELFLDSKYDPDADIRLLLESKFAEIRRHRRISDAWPGEDALSCLVEMSSGQFIVPTTVIRWVENGLPQQQLEEVLQLQKEISLSRNPFASLDTLYRHILLRTRNYGDDPRVVVKWILLMNPNLSNQYSVSSGRPTIVWSLFLEDREGEFNYRMEPMTSLVSIPPPHDTSSNVSFYHKSLLDFLLTKSRCGDDLYVDDTDMYPFIARRLLQTFKKKQVDVPFPLPDSCLGDLAGLVMNSNCNLSEYERQEGIMKGFLLYEALTPGSKAALSACDVVWWVNFIFNSNCSDQERVIGGVYCTIHKAMECNRNTPSSPEHSATKQAMDLQCHETCVRWRRDILAKVKELGWCVHRLEEIEVDELENVKWGQMDDLIKNVNNQYGDSGGCEVCLIPAVEDVSDSGSTGSLSDM